MNITKHISTLLQFHECVIIPEFGGFLSNYIPAQYNQDNHSFTPPSKEVVFNSKISKNDGLLINHIVENENIGYHQAQSSVITFVDQLFEKLNRGEKIELDKFGSFEFDHSGAITFTRFNQFDLVDAYGLKAFSYPSLEQSNKVSTFRPRPAIRVLNGKKDIIKIAASIALLLSLSLFPLKNDTLKFQSSNLNPVHLLTVDQSINENLVDNNSETSIQEKVFVEPLKKSSPFILIGGSFQHFENANQLQRNLITKGHNAEIIDLDNGYFRVVIDSFNDQSEAIFALKSYRSNHPGSSVWIGKR